MKPDRLIVVVLAVAAVIALILVGRSGDGDGGGGSGDAPKDAPEGAIEVSFAYSPENLRLGKALGVFLEPDRVVVGVRREADRERVAALLRPITGRLEWMGVESAASATAESWRVPFTARWTGPAGGVTTRDCGCL